MQRGWMNGAVDLDRQRHFFLAYIQYIDKKSIVPLSNFSLLKVNSNLVALFFDQRLVK